MNIKSLIWKIKKEKGISIQSLSIQIGHHGNFLSRALKNDSVRVSDLKKCFDCVGEPFVIIFKGEKNKID